MLHTDRRTLRPSLIGLQCFWIRRNKKKKRKIKRKKSQNKVTSHAAKYQMSHRQTGSSCLALKKRLPFKIKQLLFCCCFFLNLHSRTAVLFLFSEEERARQASIGVDLHTNAATLQSFNSNQCINNL